MNHIRCRRAEALHDHNYAELACVLAGSARHTTLRCESTCTRGDVLFIPRGAWHGYSRCQRFEVVNCLFSPTLLENELAWLRKEAPFSGMDGWTQGLDGAVVSTLHLSSRIMERLRQRLAALEAAYNRKATRIELLGHLLLTLDLLKSATVSPEHGVMGTGGGHPSVRAGLALLQRDYAREWTLEQLAICLRINRSYLVRLFRVHVGQTPMKYLSKIRAYRAATLLLTTRLRIGDIGERVGWPEPKLFSRQFKQHFAMSARDYRRKQLQPFLAHQSEGRSAASGISLAGGGRLARVGLK